MNPGDMGPHGHLSDSECEELLAVRRSDLPVGEVLSALGGTLGASLPGEAAAMAAFRAAAVPSIGRRGRNSARVVAASIGGSVVLLGGVAAAASGQVRHDLANVIGIHEHHQGSSHHPIAPITASPTPGAPGSAPSPTGSATSPTGHGKAHAGHGKGQGIGETAQPTRPAHPSHPAHPTHPATPTHRAHPTKRPHPTQAATPTHKATHPAHPTKRTHPTQAATPVHPTPTRTPSGGR